MAKISPSSSSILCILCRLFYSSRQILLLTYTETWHYQKKSHSSRHPAYFAVNKPKCSALDNNSQISLIKFTKNRRYSSRPSRLKQTEVAANSTEENMPQYLGSKQRNAAHEQPTVYMAYIRDNGRSALGYA